MSETNNTASNPTDEGPAGADSGTASVESLQAEVDKWKSLSRTNEKRWNEASAELSKFQQSQMTDAEKAIEEARNQARSAALAEYGTRLADAELRAQAAKAGVNLPSAEFLNLNKFVGDDGAVNAELIGNFVSTLPKPVADPEFDQGLGLGRQAGAGVDQLSRDDLSRMTPQEINAARKAGKLDSLMRGEI
ncbi:hypothetical protein H9W91_07255 [Streptomyces alfalfae]|uniref:hypothetical protein n=1 Tax=Streptomyces alfalfae TaxID=1642299 RepID=UPI001BA6BB7F|nr:hypothetical protein [Streptomyces alfalfae]QUI30677.1 hypothetical protein H9W91_07255 [Streptomyces alfalfae]